MSNNSVGRKLRLLGLGTVQDLLDKLIDMNSLPVVRQHLRDLKDHRDKVANMAAAAEGDKRHYEDQALRFAGQVEGLQGAIETLLGDDNPDNDKLTESMAVDLVSAEEAKATAAALYEEAVETDAALDQALGKIDTLIASLARQIEQLEMLQRRADQKRQTAKAVKNAIGAVGDVDDVSIGQLLEKKRREAATADVVLEQALSNLGEATRDETREGMAQARLAEIKARLNAAG